MVVATQNRSEEPEQNPTVVLGSRDKVLDVISCVSISKLVSSSVFEARSLRVAVDLGRGTAIVVRVSSGISVVSNGLKDLRQLASV